MITAKLLIVCENICMLGQVFTSSVVARLKIKYHFNILNNLSLYNLE